MKNKDFDFYPILKNRKKFNKIKLKRLITVCEKYGDNILKEYSLSNDFDYNRLSGDYFEKTYTQNTAIPLTDTAFKNLINLPKKAINTPFVFNSDDKHITGQYLLGSLSSKPVLYALSFVQDKKNPTTEFNLKLDACINGKDWIQLIRFDSAGEPHPNLYDENTFAKDMSEVTYVPAPHIHYCIQRSQILNGAKFDYMPAKHIEIEKLHSNNASMFENSINYFLKYANVQENINLKNLNNYNYSDYIFEDNAKDSRFVYNNTDAQNFINIYFPTSELEK